MHRHYNLYEPRQVPKIRNPKISSTKLALIFKCSSKCVHIYTQILMFRSNFITSSKQPSYQAISKHGKNKQIDHYVTKQKAKLTTAGARVRASFYNNHPKLEAALHTVTKSIPHHPTCTPQITCPIARSSLPSRMQYTP
jgi:hypothetical protein